MQERVDPFRENPRITKAVEAVMAIVGERGTVLFLEDIEQATGLKRYRGCWGTVIKKVRRKLQTERMQAIWSEHGVGYKLLTHQETVTVIPEKRQRRMFRQAGRALKEMATADPLQLNMTERRLLNSQMERLKAERKSLRSAQKELLSRFETIPQRTPFPAQQ